ncbi:hypothetical protein GIB67_028340 [Kingdonia uniflora]|uniref:UBX domain-containing protein n=1 Tax=Kingdonia uniflora TaxID=39325 RepID=A0A7J7MI88_9MAGN|nr:hypothetical protein GIB67_028340 [Kingdonia uniflora]
MARPTQEAIETFMSITGASEVVGLQKLEEHGGNLNEAVDAYFNEGDRNMVPSTSVPEPENNFMDIDDDDPIQAEPRLPLLSGPMNLDPFSLLDPNFRRNFFQGIGGMEFPIGAPQVTHPREVREIPIEDKDGNSQSSGLGPRLAIEDVTDSSYAQGPEVDGTVIIDDEEDEEIPTVPSSQFSGQNDIEEQMIRAAIEASKREAEGYPSPQFAALSDPSGVDTQSRQPHSEDPELAHAVSLSLKTAEREKAMREQSEMVGTSEMGVVNLSAVEALGKLTSAHQSSFDKGTSSHFKSEEGASPIQDEDEDEDEDVEDQPLVRQRSRIVTSESMDSLKEAEEMADDSVPLSPRPHHTGSRPQRNEDPFHSEWGGISSEEHDEAVMLEAAIFGGIPEGTAYSSYGYRPHQPVQTGFDGSMGLYPRRAPRPPSPTLEAQRIIREQQDDEYLASLQADREKELKANEEAEACRLKEQAAKEAALEEERQKEEESRRKLLEEEEMKKELAQKEASLPQEPASNDENAVNLLVKMPDGSRRGRRFLKSDLLQSLFDFIDVGKGVKPGTYRLVILLYSILP